MDWWWWLVIGVAVIAGVFWLLCDNAPNDFYEGQ